MPKQIVPEGRIDLESLGLIHQGLFEVKGELAQRYRTILKDVFDFACDVDSFRVDKRGLSPELSVYLKERYPERLEFGENYLNMGSANRYMVVVSPDQKGAPLVAPQTSYEDKLYDTVYKQARHTIEELTASETLFGELEDGIAVYRCAEDLLQLRTVKVTLDSLVGTSQATVELNQMSEHLGDRDPLHGDNALNESYIAHMRELVSKIGNVKTRAISDIFPIKTEVHCFYVEFFKAAYCLRNFRNKDDVKGIFITHHQPESKDLGEEILRLDMHDEDLLETLHKYRFLEYDPTLVTQRLREVENEFLLEQGIDVVGLRDFERKRKLSQAGNQLPQTWHELSDIAAIVESTHNGFDDKIEELGYETRLKLSTPSSKDEIINHLFAKLDPTDPVRVYRANRKKFITQFSTLSPVRQRYVAQAVLNSTQSMKGGKK